MLSSTEQNNIKDREENILSKMEDKADSILKIIKTFKQHNNNNINQLIETYNSLGNDVNTFKEKYIQLNSQTAGYTYGKHKKGSRRRRGKKSRKKGSSHKKNR